jgi:predicted component of type VI protein secretion system
VVLFEQAIPPRETTSLNADICHFVQLHGRDAGSVYSFQSGRIRIGIGEQCELILPDVIDGLPIVAAEVLLLDDGNFQLVPYQGRMPIYINGQPVLQSTTLRSEDYIRFGVGGPEVLFRHGHPDASLAMGVAAEYPTAQLEFLDGSLGGQVIPIRLDRTISIGRFPVMDIRLDLASDITVSGRHCTIRWDDLGQQFILTDCSRNGTFVDGAPVDEEALLTDGCEVRLAQTGPRFVFRVLSPQRDYPNAIASAPMAAAVDYDESYDFGVPPSSEVPVLKPATDQAASWAPPEVTNEPSWLASPPSAAEDWAASSVDPVPLSRAREESEPTNPIGFVPDPPTDPGEALPPEVEEVRLENALDETISQLPVKSGSRPTFLDDPSMKKVASKSSGTWSTGFVSGPGESGLGVPPAMRRSQATEKLNDMPLPQGKRPLVPIRLNLIAQDIKEVAAPALNLISKEWLINSVPLVLRQRPRTTLGAIGAMVILFLVFSRPSTQQLSPTDPLYHLPEPARSVAVGLRRPVQVRNPEGGFTVRIPQGWESSVEQGVVQAASPDGGLHLDIVRAEGLTKEDALKVVGQDRPEAVVVGQPGEFGEFIVHTFVSNDRGISRMGTLLTQLKNQESAPVLVVLEGVTSDVVTLPQDVLTQLLSENITVLPGEPKRPQPRQTPTSTPATAVAQTPGPIRVLSQLAPRIAENLVLGIPWAGIQLGIPDEWTGTEDSGANIIALLSPDNLDIRVSATAQDFETQAVVDGLITEGWRPVTDRDIPSSLAVLSRGEESIAVSIVDRGQLPSAVLYAQVPRAFGDDELEIIRTVVEQIQKAP